MDAPSGEDLPSVALRVLVDGAGRQGKIDTIKHLAAANGTAVRTIRGERGEALVLWLSFKAGWFEGAPLHLDVVATAASLSMQGRRQLAQEADAVIFATETSPSDVESAARYLRTSLLTTSGDQRLVVFCHRVADDGSDLAPAAVLEALGEPPTTPALVTSGSGAGIRYGFAVAVRLALNERRGHSGQDLRATVPFDAQTLLAMVRTESSAGSAATEASPVEPRPAAPPAPDERRLRTSTPAPPLQPSEVAPVPEQATPDQAIPAGTPSPGVTPDAQADAEASAVERLRLPATPPLESTNNTASRSGLGPLNAPDPGSAQLPPTALSQIVGGQYGPGPGDAAHTGKARSAVPDVIRPQDRQTSRASMIMAAAGLALMVALLIFFTLFA